MKTTKGQVNLKNDTLLCNEAVRTGCDWGSGHPEKRMNVGDLVMYVRQEHDDGRVYHLVYIELEGVRHPGIYSACICTEKNKSGQTSIFLNPIQITAMINAAE